MSSQENIMSLCRHNEVSAKLAKTLTVISGFPTGWFMSMLKAVKPGLYLVLLLMAGRLLAADPTVSPTPSPHRTNVPTAAIRQGPDALRSFQVKQGFRLEQVAAEPLVINPGAMSFDENGRLFVIELSDGIEGSEGTRGRVRVLEDTDGDGVFNTSAVYAKDLTSPSALICYGGGVFVACDDGIIYLKDTKGDGLADVKREVFKGFGEATNGANGKVTITGMAWGLDNHIHVATASRGGDVISGNLPKQAIILSEGDFAFDPRTFVLEVENGSAPSGMSFDNRGRQFVAGKNHRIRMVMYEPRYALRNSFYDLPGALMDIITGEGSGRLPDISNIVIYRGNTFPLEYVGNAFLAEAANGLVHRDKLRANDVGVIAERAADELGTDFFACTDHTFQPMQLANGPDGTLYVAGLVRELAARIGTARPNAGSNNIKPRGRIYRIVPINFRQPVLPHMGKSSASDLVSMLRHPNGWYRDTAARLLLRSLGQGNPRAIGSVALRCEFASAVPHACVACAGRDEHVGAGAFGQGVERSSRSGARACRAAFREVHYKERKPA